MLVLSACGQRALPLVDGGVEPDSQAPPHTTPHPGCQSNNDCPAGSYCFVKGCTGSGSCAQRPTSCPLLAISEPVCGCDGKTYSNDCMRQVAGVALDHQGACAPSPNRTVATGVCVRNSFDACSQDSDCVSGGCGGELCFNPAVSGGASFCDCVQPTGVSCGCVNGKCAWWK